MSYFRLATSRAFTETKKFWSIHQIWALCSVPVVGFCLHALIRKTHLVGWQEIVLFVIFGFIVAWGGSYLINLIRVPAILHHEQTQVIVALEKDKEHLQGAINTLSAEVNNLKRPKRTPFQEKEYQRIDGLIGKHDEDCIAVLRHLMRHGKMGKYQGGPIENLPDGLDCKRAEIALKKLLENQVVTRETIPQGNMRWQQWTIAPGVNSALEELL